MIERVATSGQFSWTAAGGSRLNTRTGEWSLFNERNTPMYEIWTYAVTATPDKVYYAVWGSGLLEYNQKTKVWDKYDDPDGETEMSFLRRLAFEGPPSASFLHALRDGAKDWGLSSAYQAELAKL